MLLWTNAQQHRLPSLDRACCTDVTETEPKVPSRTRRRPRVRERETRPCGPRARLVQRPLSAPGGRFLLECKTDFERGDIRASSAEVCRLKQSQWSTKCGKHWAKEKQILMQTFSEPFMCLGGWEKGMKFTEFPRIYLTIYSFPHCISPRIINYRKTLLKKLS